MSDCHEKVVFDLSLRPLAGFLPRGVETTCVRVDVKENGRDGGERGRRGASFENGVDRVTVRHNCVGVGLHL